MGNPTEERKVFTGFLLEAPLFAGAPIAYWSQPVNDPPDVEANLASGRKIGIELTSWLDESQIGREKKVEFLEASFRAALQPDPPNQTEHIFLVRMGARKPIAASDRAAFRAELIALMEAIDKRWESEPDWQSPQGFVFADFNDYSTLAKYLTELIIHSKIPSVPMTMRKGVPRWLTFPMRGGAYSPDWMVDSFCECIKAKTKKYAAKPTGIDDFYLLLHYDKAFFYNTPVEGIDFSYAEAVQAAAARIGNAVGLFDKIVVFVPIAKGQQVFQMYP